MTAKIACASLKAARREARSFASGETTSMLGGYEARDCALGEEVFRVRARMFHVGSERKILTTLPPCIPDAPRTTMSFWSDILERFSQYGDTQFAIPNSRSDEL